MKKTIFIIIIIFMLINYKNTYADNIARGILINRDETVLNEFINKKYNDYKDKKQEIKNLLLNNKISRPRAVVLASYYQANFLSQYDEYITEYEKVINDFATSANNIDNYRDSINNDIVQIKDERKNLLRELGNNYLPGLLMKKELSQYGIYGKNIEQDEKIVFFKLQEKNVKKTIINKLSKMSRIISINERRIEANTEKIVLAKMDIIKTKLNLYDYALDLKKIVSILKIP